MATVLIAEDDGMIAGDLEDILIEAGFEVCGVAGSVAQAIRLGQQCRPDLGLIDLHLRYGELGTDIAAALCPGTRFGVLYATGNPDHPLLAQAPGVGCIGKPYSAWSVLAALRVVGDIAAGRPVQTPGPRGFRLLREAGAISAAVTPVAADQGLRTACR